MQTELYWIDGPWRGRLAIMPRPRGGDWLGDEMRGWREAGIDVVVSLLTPAEITELDLALENALVESYAMKYLSFPIEDRSVPESRDETLVLTNTLSQALDEGKNVAIHCRQGIGRAALIAACLLVSAGMSAGEAFRRVTAARGCPVPETSEQRNWVEAYSRQTPATARI